MKPETQKDLIKFLARQLRETMHHLYAYRVAAQAAEDHGIPFKATVQTAFNDPGVKARVDHQISALEESIEKDPDSQEERIAEILHNWKPEGLPN